MNEETLGPGRTREKAIYFYIRGPGWKFASGIRDKHPGSATLNYRVQLPGRDAVWRVGNRCIPAWQAQKRWGGGRGAELGWEGCPSHSGPAICNRVC